MEDTETVRLTVLVEKPLRDAAEAATKAKGYRTVAEYLREQLRDLVAAGDPVNA